jgi:ABC-type sugar transport system substrate-binding protein
MIKNKHIALVAGMAVASALAGCGSSGSGGNAASGQKSYTIAQIRWDAGDIFFNGVAAGEKSEIANLEKEHDVKINVKTVAANDAGDQLNGLQQLITQGIDGVSLVPWRGESMVAVLKQLEAKKIPVVVHNLTVPGADAPFVAFDNVEAGRLAGEAIVKQIEAARGADWADKGGTIMLLRGDITASFDKDRFTGYSEVLDKVVAENPKVKVVVRADLGYQGEPARAAVSDAVTSFGAENILAVGSVDGTMSVGGAIPALKSAGAVIGTGKPNAVAITSVDCSKAELDSIAKKELTHCSEQPALIEGQLVSKMLYDMMSNGLTEPSDGVESVDAWADKPWGPIEVTTRDDMAGPWYKTKAFGVPAALDVTSPDHWAIASGASGN